MGRRQGHHHAGQVNIGAEAEMIERPSFRNPKREVKLLLKEIRK